MTEDDNAAKLKKLSETSKMVFGKEESITNLKRGNLKKVLLSANCPSVLDEDIVHYATIGSVELVRLPQQNTELGIIFKKQFSVSVIGVM